MIDLKEIVVQRLDELGLSAIQAAEQNGLERAFIYDIVLGKKRSVRADKLPALARALSLDAAALAAGDVVPLAHKPKGSAPPDTGDGVRGPISLPQARLPYAGVVQAGAFLLLDDYFNQDDSDQMVPLGVAPHPEFMSIRQGAWQARGDSMSLAKPPILEGMWIVAGDYSDYVDKIGELGNGSYVIVERVTDGGSKRERTVKEVQFARRGMRLIPHSANPVYKEFFIPLDAEADSDTEMVHILAVVLWAGWDMDPRSR